MFVLAFLSDPEIVGKRLHHLGLPTTAPRVAIEVTARICVP